MTSRYAALVEALRSRVLDGPGALDASVRRAAFAGDAVPDDLAAYVDNVRRHAYKVTDDEVAALRTQRTDDELFEVTVATALGAGLSRLDAALDALHAGQAP